MKNLSDSIQKFIIDKVGMHPSDIVAYTANHFKVTRTTVHRHLSKLISKNKIIMSGTTRSAIYCLSTSVNRKYTFKIQPGLSEFEVYVNNIAPALKGIPINIEDICNYAFTEIFNNAIDHSYGTRITVVIEMIRGDIVISIQDNGIGIFKNICNYFSLDDIRESVLQLNKGKMTTDPANHTGEGIFFTSRSMDIFEIHANNLIYIRDNRENDWGLQSTTENKPGSKIIMRINKSAIQNLITIFQRYQDNTTLAFDRTDIIVEMAKLGDETLISRSQAKRIVRDLEKFNHVTLDFKGIRLVGQGFVDEIFRIFTSKFPNMKIDYINANADVEFMIKRG